MDKVFTIIPKSAPQLVVPGCGFEQWHDRNDVPMPTAASPKTPYDVYYRTTWNRFEGATPGSYNFEWLRARLNDAISKKQTFSMGIMSVYTGVDGNTGGVLVNGTWSAMPLYLVNQMLSENPKCFTAGGCWIPNLNSTYYQQRCLALNMAINNFIYTNSSPSGVPYKFAMGIFDVRLYGNWGENHSAYSENFTVSQYPSGTFPTGASLKKVIEAHTQGFPDNPLVAMISGFDAQWLNNTWNPPQYAYDLLTMKNNWGELGWRRDNWGAKDGYIDDYLKNNTRSYNGVVFKDLIMQKWKKAPVTGEPPAWNPDNYDDLLRQVTDYNPTSFGNGNWGVQPPIPSTIADRARAAYKECGFRFVVTKASANFADGKLNVTMNWQNQGRGNCWQNWDVWFELVGTSFKAKSKHVLKFFQPSTTSTAVTESFPVIGVANGTYSLRFVVKDPNGYRVNMPLYIEGADASMNYTIGNIEIGGATVPNVAPIANAGVDRMITLPINSVVLGGSGADTDGVITAYKWEKVSGSGDLENQNTANARVINLTEGQTILKFTVTDDDGATGSDNLVITVNGATPTPPKITSVAANIKDYLVKYDNGTSEVVPA